jgi:hypothetical protein
MFNIPPHHHPLGVFWTSHTPFFFFLPTHNILIAGNQDRQAFTKSPRAELAAKKKKKKKKNAPSGLKDVWRCS